MNPICFIMNFRWNLSNEKVIDVDDVDDVDIDVDVDVDVYF